MDSSLTDRIEWLDRPGGRISYTVSGTGPLVIAVPGMGDLRSSYRELVEPLVAAGFRVAVTDVRGHGDADTGFVEHGDEATAGDLLALIEELGGPAVVIGNSFGGSAAVLAASRRPRAVSGLVLLSPFLRERGSRAAAAAGRLLYRALLARPWGAAVWARYYAGPLNAGRHAPWLPEQVAAIRSSFSDPRRLAELRRLAVRLDHSVVEPVLGSVRAPALIIVGALDPDYRDPQAELDWMGERLAGSVELVPEAAHYPHAQRPDVVVPLVVAFAGRLGETTGRRDADA